MGSDVGHEPSYDTHLARLLHERGRVGVEVLRGLLDQTRAQRDMDPSLSLALSLVEGGILSREEADDYLAEITTLAPAPPSSSTADELGSDDLVEWRPGGKVDRYHILEQLGQGGMGTVFRAERDGEQVAIKVLPLGAAEPGLQERFTREYTAQSALNPHPNVVRVRGAGIARGARYLVLDLATGGDLQTRLRRGPLLIPEATEMARQLARGLAHVHAHGILHRDLKPGNVLFDADGTPKLVDFGLARSTVGASTLTQTGEVVGTPSYMAPEQATALRGSIGIPSDIYGLGAVLFHALTGRPPFVGASTLDVLTQVVTAPPPRPSSIRRSVPRALDEIVLCCLSKAPEQRYPSADALADALERLRRGQARRIPPALVAAAIASLLLAVVAVVIGGSRRPGETAGSDPAPAAPTPNTRSTPSAIARPAQPLDLFAPPVGQRLRATVAVRSKRELLVNGGRAKSEAMNAEFTGEIQVEGEVIEAAPTRLVCRITLDRLRLRNVGGLEGKRLFDSGVVSHRAQPFSAALRKSFTFTLDPRTGAVLKVEGVEAIQKAIYAAGPADATAEALRVDLFQPTALIDTLNRFWCILPHPRLGPDAMTWIVAPPAPQHMSVINGLKFLAFMGHGVQTTSPPPTGPVSRTVKVTKRIDQALHVTWRGQKDVRRYRAEAVIVGGWVRWAKVREHLKFTGLDTTGGRKKLVEWVFQNEYGIDLKLLKGK